MVYERYSNRVGELVTGTVQQYERGNVIIDIGYAEALLPFSEQPRGERYHYGDRIRAVIQEVNESTRDAQVILSRKTPELVRKLFEQEVTEVRDGTVVIREVAREPGRRSKIAVMSTNLDVDPVGACVGMKGSRVQMVVQELKGERIDIIPYSQDKAKFIQNSLKPAEVELVELEEGGRRAMLTVKDDQLSLAIGKGGLNAKLASELTGTEIDIVSVSELEASERETRSMLASLPGVNEETVEDLMSLGIWSYDNILEYGVEGMVETLGMDRDLAARIHASAEKFVSGKGTPSYLAESGSGAAERESTEDTLGTGDSPEGGSENTEDTALRSAEDHAAEAEKVTTETEG
jgi:N utilization substance protein A